jgi:hypothetical protein
MNKREHMPGVHTSFISWGEWPWSTIPGPFLLPGEIGLKLACPPTSEWPWSTIPGSFLLPGEIGLKSTCPPTSEWHGQLYL